ncbi:MAG: Fic family protein [Patescibacteria group bacterium]
MNETIKLNTRQKEIVNTIAKTKSISRERLSARLPEAFQSSKATLARDLKYLVKKGLIISIGSGPSTAYNTASTHPLLAYVDLKQYFSIEPDNRKLAKTVFDAGVFELLPGLLESPEQSALDKTFRSFDKSTKKLDPTILERELERYVIELSWKSSKIEGNTYSLLETESLIKQGIEAKGKSREEADMILNHKDACKTLIEHRTSFKKLQTKDVLELHGVLTKNLPITSGIRKQAVGITGTTYKPLSHAWELKEAVKKMINLVNKTAHPLEKALIVSALMTYIQPFADGNKRTARMLSNAVLLAYDHFPLSYRSINENEYKQALIIFYETNNMYHLKRLFLDQYHFAVNNYF